MPFILYDVTPSHYQRLREVKVAGSSGPLARIQQMRNTTGQCPFAWHATAAELIAAIGGHSGQEIVIDLKPGVRRNVSLYRLCDVWGYSCQQWTRLAIRLECLFVDHEHADPAIFKSRFRCPDPQRSMVGEFLYVRGGVTGGGWNWGQVGRVNGTLL